MSASSSFHDANSNTYDRMACGATYSIAKQLVPFLPPITTSSRILDNACGTGVVTEVIKTAYAAAHITAADLSPGVLEIYKSKASRNNWDNTQTEVLDVRDLGRLEDESFSHTITNFGFVNTPDDQESPLKAAKEMYRVTEKGGAALITIWAGMLHFQFHAKRKYLIYRQITHFLIYSPMHPKPSVLVMSHSPGSKPLNGKLILG
jgi:ubiquinone/menaquinone biosynthesis C-methylase UbiE